MHKLSFITATFLALAPACGGSNKPAAVEPSASTSEPTAAAAASAPASQLLLTIKPFTLTAQGDFKVTVDAQGAIHATKDGQDAVVATLDPAGRLVITGRPAAVELASDGTLRTGDRTLGSLDASGVLTNGSAKIYFGADGVLVGGVDKTAPKVEPAGDPEINRAAVLVMVAMTARKEPAAN